MSKNVDSVEIGATKNLLLQYFSFFAHFALNEKGASEVRKCSFFFSFVLQEVNNESAL